MILRNREHRRIVRFGPVLFTAGMVTFTMFSMQTPAQETETADLTVTENIIGTLNGHDYELWKDSGNTEMIIREDGTFSCSWNGINNALFRIGKKLPADKTYDEYETIRLTYEADYQPVGNSYLCVYGWTKEPLVEYYVVESWGTWRPPGAVSMGTIEVDDAEYDVYTTVRETQPSIEGTQTFSQFWSVRKEKAEEGTVSLTEHFDAWKEMGMELGRLYETALTVEGYQSQGTADIIKNELVLELPEATAEVDIDLSVMPASVAYAQATSMQKEPEDYVGKLVRIAGMKRGVGSLVSQNVTPLEYNS